MTENDEPQIFKKRYKIVKKLGAGNFGTAYLVNDLKLKNDSKVLKVVRLGEMDADQSVDSVHEAELLSNLNNEHIVKFYESFLENDCLCIVTEYCEGGDLDQRFKQLKKQNIILDEDQVTEWLIQILIAVQYMHKSRILHRDLKARNIFLKSNNIKIGDFGISRILVGTMDVANTFTGTPYYMSPEVMKHDGYESKSDIWSVGCLLYEMCTYQHAFDGKGLMNVIYKVVEGKTPNLPNTYSKELNDILEKMFTKDPKQRPSAVELLQTSYILKYRQKIQMNIQLETTINAGRRLEDIHARLKTPINFGEMQKQSWSLSGRENSVKTDENHDDDNDVQTGNNTFYKRNIINREQQDNEEQTLKEENTQKTARQTMIERKLREADARGQIFRQEIQSNTLETALNRQMMRESTIVGTMKQPWPSANNVEIKEQTQPRFSRTFNNRTRHINQFSNEGTYALPNTSLRSDIINKTNRPVTDAREINPMQTFSRHSDTISKSNQNRYDDRPITPMRGSFKQIAEKFGDEDGLPTDPNLTNQYYEAYNDFEKEEDFSPTRENKFHDHLCRSVTEQETSGNSKRILSASQHSTTMNSMSRTIDPHSKPNLTRPSRYMAPSKTMANVTKQRPLSSRTINDNNVTLKDNPTHDAFGPIAKDKKITSLRTKSVDVLGESTFEKVHDYLIKQRTLQRTDSTLDESRIFDGLTAFVKKPSDCFLVDQLVFLELV